MLAHVRTGAVTGIDPFLVRVEVSLATGLPSFAVVGMAQGAVREGRERVGAALRSAGFGLPNRRITVNLAPAAVRKEGAAFDLPIALGLLAAAGELAPAHLEDVAFMGELGLDGALRPVAGVLPVAALCRERGVEILVVPAENAPEAALIEGLRVHGAATLGQVVEHLKGRERLPRATIDVTPLLEAQGGTGLDIADVRGQEAAKRALEIAAAGSHNLLLLGTPGAGKTMLARRLPGILPPLTPEEALEATRVHSVAGLLLDGGRLVTERPFRAPHHSVSDAGLVGGGSPCRPGEMSLAHHGVLFLDELPEFRRNALEALRQPLEDGAVTLSRVTGSVRLPARFLLVAAMNPCPCGYWGDGTDRCLCDPVSVTRYRGRVSGPLLDRVDLHVHVPAVPFERLGLAPGEGGDASWEVRERVACARRIQSERFAGVPGVHANAHMRPRDLREWCAPPPGVVDLLRCAVERTGLSARAYHRILKVARTIADLDGEDVLEVHHAAEALQYRVLDRSTVL